MLRRPCTPAAVLVTFALAGCGGDNDDATNREAPERAETPAAQACPPQTDQILDDAAFRMSHDDFDGAFAVMDEVKEVETDYRAIAARTTLRIARARLREAERANDNDTSPQPAVSLARNSIRYKDTPEARAFLKKAEAALAAFKRKYGPRPDEEPGGPPPGAGEGGPPEGRGDE